MADCGACGKKVAKSAKALACNFCELWYHTSCAALTDTDYDFMKNRSWLGFRWFCVKCVGSADGAAERDRRANQVDEKLSSIVSAVEGIGQRLKDLESKPDSIGDPRPQSFAAIIKETISEVKKSEAPSKTSTILPQEVLLVKPKEGTTIDQGKTEAARTGVELALKSIPVDSCRKTRNGGLVVKFPSKALKDRASLAIEGHLGQDSDFSVSEPARIKPKMTITGIPIAFPNEEILDSIAVKSPEVGELLGKGFTMELMFTREKGQNKYAVIKMSPEIRAAILKRKGRVYVGLSSCRAYDRFWVTQCFHCQRFGHKYADCPMKQDQPTCTFCAGRHESRSCTNKSSLCCANCSSVENDNVNAAHSSSSVDCPTMVTERRKLIERTELSV